jgi:two-component system, NtrC family, response regulator HydG
VHFAGTTPHTMSYGSSRPLPTSAARDSCSATEDASGPLRFVSRTPSFLDALARVERYARHDQVNVLLEGESGTGKSYFAHHLHQRSRRRRGPFQHVVLSTLDDNLAASDLFGHVSGAYTDARHGRPGHFVSATGGTLFLDEIGKASLSVQRKLLHVVEHGEIWPVGSDRVVRVDVRLVAASNVSLADLVRRGEFLPDLYARLSGFEIHIPALRERADDIPLLVEQLIAQHATHFGYVASPPQVDPALLRVMQHAAWPSNLRQLDATLRKLLIEAEGDATLTLDHLGDGIIALGARGAEGELSLDRVRQAIEITGSATAAGRMLGVSRQTVYRYLARARPADTSDPSASRAD